MRSDSSVPQASRAAPLALAFPLVALALFALFAAAFSPVARAENNVSRIVGSRVVRVAVPAAPKGLTAYSAVALDADTGRRLWARRPDKQRLIASTTKIMTALVAISRTTPNQMLTAQPYAAGPGESLLGLKAGERMSAQDMIGGMMLVSGNDAAYTLATDTARSRSAFVDAMNRRARALGLTKTHFENPIGLDSSGNHSTARDLAKLAQYALSVPRLAHVVDKAHLTLRTGAKVRHVSNLNPLIGKYPWAIGVKTGHTTAAGYLLVGAAKKLDARLVSVVTGEPSEAGREDDSITLLRYARAFYKPVTTLNKSKSLYAMPLYLQDGTADVYPTRDYSLAARNGERLAVQLDSAKELKGPLAAGAVVGTATVLRDGRAVAKSPIAIHSAVAAAPTSAVMLHALGVVLPWLLLAAAICLLMAAFFQRRRERTQRPGYVG